MEWLWYNIERGFKVLFSCLVALARLIVWTLVFFFTGLQRTLFTRSEIVGVEFRITPWRCDIEDTDDKISFVDKLYCENPDLACLVEEADEDDLSFLDDDEFPPNEGEEGEEE